MKLSLLALLVALLLPLAAHAAEASFLDEPLGSAFGVEERREVLRLACLNTAEKITGFPPRVMHHRLRHRPNAETEQVKKLCRRMTALYRDPQDTSPVESAAPVHERQMLANECAETVKRGMEKAKPEKRQHFQNMRTVCEKLTGRTIVLE